MIAIFSDIEGYINVVVAIAMQYLQPMLSNRNHLSALVDSKEILATSRLKDDIQSESMGIASKGVMRNLKILHTC